MQNKTSNKDYSFVKKEDEKNGRKKNTKQKIKPKKMANKLNEMKIKWNYASSGSYFFCWFYAPFFTSFFFRKTTTNKQTTTTVKFLHLQKTIF